MLPELSKTYEPASIQGPITKKWLDHKAFAAHPDARAERYVIMMPLPNVTGALHMGHAMDNVMQDLLTRWHRMRGDNALWQAGTDHAGIATQAVVEKRLFELEKRSRHDLGREGLVRRIWEWKDQYQARIIQQQQQMGCSCDWDRQRFTMDKVCARAVRHWFFGMFRDGLIYRGNRLVNWDCFLQTAVADDETYHEKVRGHFWHLRYPVLNARAGEPKFVVVATTRPETMLGDTAVAVHPDPAAALERVLEETRARLAEAPAKEKPALEQELERIEARKTTHLPTLQVLAGMAMQGRRVEVPLVDRAVPIVLDGAVPDADARYRLRLPPGAATVRVVDLVTGVEFTRAEVKAEAGKALALELSCKVAKLRARLRPEGKGTVVAERLVIQAGDQEHDNEFAVFAFLGGWSNLGVPLSCGASEVDVFVPPGTMRLKVLSGAQRLASGQLQEEPAVLGELEHEAKPGEQPVLNVPVGAPPEVK